MMYGVFYTAVAICFTFLCSGCIKENESAEDERVDTVFLNFECWNGDGGRLISSNKHTMNATVERDGLGLPSGEYWILGFRAGNDVHCPDTSFGFRVVDPNTEEAYSFFVSENGRLSISQGERSSDFPFSDVLCNVRVQCKGEPMPLFDIPGFAPSDSRIRENSLYFLGKIERRLSEIALSRGMQTPVAIIQSLDGFRIWLESEYRRDSNTLDLETRYQVLRILRRYLPAFPQESEFLQEKCIGYQSQLDDALPSNADGLLDIESSFAEIMDSICNTAHVQG